jgi:hypothetical protein
MYPGTCLKGPRKSGTTGTSVRITGNKAEFWTQDVPNTKQEFNLGPDVPCYTVIEQIKLIPLIRNITEHFPKTVFMYFYLLIVHVFIHNTAIRNKQFYYVSRAFLHFQKTKANNSSLSSEFTGCFWQCVVLSVVATRDGRDVMKKGKKLRDSLTALPRSPL